MKRCVETVSFRVWDGKKREPIWYNAILEEAGGIFNWRLASPRSSRYRSWWLDRYCGSCELYFASYRNGECCPCCGSTGDVRNVDLEDDVFNGDAPF